jgi:hypothetical protein
MNAAGLRDRYNDLLLERTRDVQYPSRELLDRLEISLRDRDTAFEYIETLLEKVQGRYPSLELLDRINAVLSALELQEVAQERWERAHAEHEEAEA